MGRVGSGDEAAEDIIHEVQGNVSANKSKMFDFTFMLSSSDSYDPYSQNQCALLTDVGSKPATHKQECGDQSNCPFLR